MASSMRSAPVLHASCCRMICRRGARRDPNRRAALLRIVVRIIHGTRVEIRKRTRFAHQRFRHSMLPFRLIVLSASMVGTALKIFVVAILHVLNESPEGHLPLRV